VRDRSKLICISIGAAAASACVLFVLFFKGTVFEAVPWQVEGQVFDIETNGLADVAVLVEGVGTVKNGLLGSAVESVQSKARTDADGKFTLSFNAAQFRMTFSKSNYLDTSEDHIFQHIGMGGESTNQTMQVIMRRVSNP
jgi:hypothetical protein